MVDLFTIYRVVMVPVVLILASSHACANQGVDSNQVPIVWQASAPQPTSSSKFTRHAAAVVKAAFSLDGMMLLTGSIDKTAVLRDSRTGKSLQTWQHDHAVLGVAFSPDGKHVLTADTRTVSLRDIATGKTLRVWQFSPYIRDLSFSSDGLLFRLRTGDKTLLLDVGSGALVKEISTDVASVDFLEDLSLLLTGSWDKTARLRDVKSGNLLATWSHDATVFSVAFSADGRSAITGSADRTASIWDVATRRLLKKWGGFNAGVESVSLSPNGTRFLVRLSDPNGTAFLKDANTGEALHTWSNVTVATFSKDGNKVLTGYTDGSLALWAIDGGTTTARESLTTALDEELRSAEANYRALPARLADRKQALESYSVVKNEFESSTQFGRRIAQWNKDVSALNADIQTYYSQLGSTPLKIRAAAIERALSRAYGNPRLEKIFYEPETAKFYGTLVASLNPEFRQAVSIAVPNDKARAVKDRLESKDSGIEVEMYVTEQNELVWGPPRIKFDGRVYAAQYTDGDFIETLTTQLAAAPEFQTITLSPDVAYVPTPVPQIITDPNLAMLQVEVMQKEREQALSAARQAEEKRLKVRLAELDRRTDLDFNDDLPSLVAKLPVAKPNSNLYVFAVGIYNYADVPDVPFADRSARQFSEISQRLYGAPKQNVTVLTNAEATSGRLRGRLRIMLNRLGPKDRLLFYYAGHGVPGKDGRDAYLLAQDGGPGSYEEPDLQLEQLFADIAKSRVGQAKLFIDACFSGRSGKDTIVFEGIAPITVSPKQSFPTSSRLAVLSAGRGDQFSNQSKERGHRLFSYHLMRSLLEGGTKLEMTELHMRLRDRVLDESRRIGPEFEQEPELQGNGKLLLNQ